MPAQLFADSTQSRVFTEFPGQARRFALEMGIDIWALLYVQVSLKTGLLDGLCSFSCALVRFPG